MVSRRSNSLAVLVAAAALVVGCSTPKPPERAQISEPGAQEIPAAQPSIEPDPTEPPETTARQDAPAQAPASPSSGIDLPQPNHPEIAAATPHADLPGPEKLIGLSSGKVEDLLGTPVFRRRDPPAELWQYTSPRCILDVFLYRTKASPKYLVTHLEARGRTVGKIPLRECYLSLETNQKS